MNTASEILVIIVSVALAIFLTVLVVALLYTIKIMKQIKQITEHAENVAGSMESAAEAFKKTATPLAVLKLVGNIMEHAGRMRRKKG